MKKVIISLAVIAAGTTLFFSCGENPAPPAATGPAIKDRLPQDVKVTCTVSQDTFNTWFKDGKPTENGTVLPANSVTFPHENNCSFYTWSEQMFLWIVSPTSGGKYVPGNTVLESPVFYDVTSATNGKRYMIRHEPGKLMKVMSSITQNGPHNLPMVRDQQGNLFEVLTQEITPGKKMLLKNAAGAIEELAMMEKTPDGKHIFKNRAGKVIAAPKPQISIPDNENILVAVHSHGDTALLDAKGNEKSLTEVGQATNDALIAQNGSIVYYLLTVNDVYAFYATACANGAMSNYQFPITAAGRDSVCAYARKNGVTLPDSNALAVELKTSWVEAKDLPNPGSYITVEAEIPEYNTSDPKKWIPTGKSKKATLALTGIHVVGSLAGHPEMAWATFEHVNNAPNAAYQYINTKGDTVVVPQDTGRGYLLCGNTADAPFNKSHMKTKGDTINGNGTFSISASNTMMMYAFGSAMNTATNQEDRSSAAANSEVIGINNAIRKMLVGNDLRKNYILIGATWTQGGVAPNTRPYTATDTVPGVAIGTNLLANSTMETYFQYSFASCFYCHANREKPNLRPDTLSHIFGQLQPLPTVPKSMK